MLKLLALGTLGYVGYRYYQKQAVAKADPPPATDQVAVAGGPLSEYATLQSDPNQPPAIDPYGGNDKS